MSRRSRYPTDLDGRALLWRHRHVMRLLERRRLPVDPYEALWLVVHPGPELLEASRAAVQQKVAA